MRLLTGLHPKVLCAVPSLHSTLSAAITAAVEALLHRASLTVPALSATTLPPASSSPHPILTLDGKRLQRDLYFHALKADRVEVGLTLSRSHPRVRLHP